MIPKFPQFKNLELSDKKDIEKIAFKYEPYSDFDFASMWSWNTSGNRKISQLNGNLVVILSDHFLDHQYYSFLGNNEVNKTLKQIFAFSEITETPIPILRCVPEISLENIDLKKFIIEIDLNNCDYIYNTEDLAKYEGSGYATKRKLYNRFLRNNPDYKVVTLDLNDQETKSQIMNFSRLWMTNKSKEDVGLNLEKEYKAIQTFIDANVEGSYCIGLKVKDQLIGYQLCTLLPRQYSICHFGKIDIKYHGAFEFMMSESSKLLISKGVKYLNTEEDLGLPGLRFTKNSYHPTTFLRKYTIREI